MLTTSRVLGALLSFALIASGCGDDDGTTDAGRDDAGAMDGGGTDAGDEDAGRADGGVDAGSEGEVVRASLGAAGGSLTSADGVFELVIPEGALEETVEISIRVVPRAEWPSEAVDADPIAGVYDVQPDGLELAVPALAIHAFDGRPSVFGAAAAPLPGASHFAIAEGALEEFDTTTLVDADGDVAVVGEIDHFSLHFAGFVDPRSLSAGSTSSGAASEHELEVELTGGAAATTDVDVEVFPLDSGAAVSGTSYTSRTPDPIVSRFFAPMVGTGRTFEDATLGGGGFTASPAPRAVCTEDATVQMLASAFASTARTTRQRILVAFAILCVAEASPIMRVAVSANPEFPRIWTDGTLVVVGNPPAGPATHTAVTSSGTRFTQPFAQPAYDFILYPGATTTNLWGAGPMNEWVTNFSSTEFLGTGLGRNGNFTSVRRFPQMGTPMRFGLASFGLSLLTVYGADRTATGNVLAGQFVGGAWPAAPISFDFGPFGEVVLFALGNGNVYFGAPTPTGSTPTVGSVSIVDTGDPEDDPRFVRCFENSSDLHVCAIAAFGADEIHVYEVTPTMARKTAEIAVGDGPIDPAVIADGADSVLIAVGGSNDDSFTLLRYAPSTEVLTQVGDTVTLDDCDQPNHANFATPTDLLVSCYGSAVVLRFDPMDLVL